MAWGLKYITFQSILKSKNYGHLSVEVCPLRALVWTFKLGEYYMPSAASKASYTTIYLQLYTVMISRNFKRDIYIFSLQLKFRCWAHFANVSKDSLCKR